MSAEASGSEIVYSFVHYLLHDQIHFVLEAIMVTLLVYILVKKPTKRFDEADKLSEEEIDELVADWQPQPLHRALSPQQQLDSAVPVIDEAHGARVRVGERQLLNLGSINPLGLLGEPDIDAAAEAALRKYGCGSCGPRGFYGTIDVHLELERDLADFMGCEQTILYSSGFATVASVIPTFAKRNDIIFCDAGVNHAVATGVNLSRSHIVYFRHNDMAHLAELLEKAASDPQTARKRKFVVCEGLYYNYGDVLPLPQVLKLKDRHCFYLIVDESYSVGTLGAHGGGLLEVYGGKRGGETIDIITGNLGNVACSVGGFCSGNNSVVTHQRLNGSGYVFSASLPPYLSCVAMAALKRIRNDDERRATMMQYVEMAHKALGACKALRVRSAPQSPIIHVELAGAQPDMSKSESVLATEKRLQALVDKCMDKGVLLTRAKYADAERARPPPSIRMCIPASLTKDEVAKALQSVCEVAATV